MRIGIVFNLGNFESFVFFRVRDVDIFCDYEYAVSLQLRVNTKRFIIGWARTGQEHAANKRYRFVLGNYAEELP